MGKTLKDYNLPRAPLPKQKGGAHRVKDKLPPIETYTGHLCYACWYECDCGESHGDDCSGCSICAECDQL